MMIPTTLSAHRRAAFLAGLLALTACGAPATPSPFPPANPSGAVTAAVPAFTPSPAPTQAPAASAAPPASVAATETAAFSLPAPDCAAGPTPAQTEGPYYTADTPQDAALAEAGMTGTPLVVTGYVLTAACQPIANAWLDFWQADAAGVYDNQGYTLRGHQYTDAAGRYTLETILPGVYPGRPPHIHVKVRAPDSAQALTTQLYFPEAGASNQADGIFDARLLVTWLETPAGQVAVYNFILAAP